MSQRSIAIGALLALLASPIHAQGMRAGSAGGQPLALTLDSATALAVSVATQVQTAQFNARIAQEEVTRSVSDLLPSAGVLGYRTYDYGNQLVSSTAIVPWESRIETMGYQLSTSLNLLGPLSGYPGLRAARDVRTAAGYSLARTTQSAALDGQQGFLQVVLDSQLVEIATENDSLSREQVRQLQELVRVGKRPPADLYRAMAQEAADEALVFNAINRQRADQIALLQLLHIDPQRHVTLAQPALDTSNLSSQYEDTVALATAALIRRTDLQSAQAEIDARQWSLRQAGTEVLPNLYVGFSVLANGRVFDQTLLNGANQVTGIQTALAPQVGNQTTTLFSVGLGYNLFSALRSHIDQQEARVGYEGAQLAAGDVRLAVIGDVTRAISEYNVARQQLASARSGLSSAQASYDLTSGRFAVGFASIVDLLTAQAALVGARSLDAEALIQLSLSKRALAFAMGLNPTDRLQ